MKRMSGNALNFASLRLAYDRNDSMPLIGQLPRANSLRMDAEMLLITHIHQSIVAPPTIRVDDATRVPGPESRPVAASWRHPGRSPCRLSLPFQDSEDDCFTPGSTPLFSPDTAGAKRGFIPFNLAGKRR